METRNEARTRKIALRIVGGLAVLVFLCCGGFALFTNALHTGVVDQLNALDTKIGATFPKGTVWRMETLVPDVADPQSLQVIVLGLPELPPEDERAKIVDDVWRLYCETFTEGGLGVDEVALGVATAEGPDRTDQVAPHSGEVTGWAANRTPVATIVARTGLAAPADLELIEMMGDSVRVGVGEDEQ